MNDSNRSSQRGPARLPSREKRVHCVSTRFNIEELSRLDGLRGVYQRGEWLRLAAFNTLSPTIPAINQDAWAVLSRLTTDLKQALASRNFDGLSSHQKVSFDELMDAVSKLRLQLLGVKL